MEDHFTINVARRINPDTKPFGPYHSHLFKVTIPASNTKLESLEIYQDMCVRYPEPEFRVTLSRVSIRNSQVRESGGKGVFVSTAQVLLKSPIGA